jgi:hypothetical protein
VRRADVVRVAVVSVVVDAATDGAGRTGAEATRVVELRAGAPAPPQPASSSAQPMIQSAMLRRPRLTAHTLTGRTGWDVA